MKPKGLSPVSVALAIPVFNEADGIEQFIDELESAFEEFFIERTYVIVNDASTDGTKEVLETIRKKVHASMILLDNEENKGHGPTTLRAYFRALETDSQLILQVDGDGQFCGSDVAAIARTCFESNRAVIGVRKNRQDPWFRRLLGWQVRQYLRLVFSTWSPDPNTPLRAFPKNSLLKHLDALPSNPLVPNIYLTILLHRSANAPLYQIVDHRPRRGISKEGSTWRSARRFRILPIRLIKFVSMAGIESVRFWRSSSKSWRSNDALKDHDHPHGSS
jgi:dolichol-phosphate mannosyltransferase